MVKRCEDDEGNKSSTRMAMMVFTWSSVVMSWVLFTITVILLLVHKSDGELALKVMLASMGAGLGAGAIKSTEFLKNKYNRH